MKTVYGEKNIIKFRLTEGRHSHKVTVWGALCLHAAYKTIKEATVIFIVSSCKLKFQYNNICFSSCQISTLPSSKIYLNLDNEVVTEAEFTAINIEFPDKQYFHLRLSEEGYVPQEKSFYSPARSDVVPAPVIETLSLKELSEKTSSEFLKYQRIYPFQINEICGKDVTLQIELNDDNIHLSSTVYTANDAYSSVVAYSSTSEATISGIEHSGFGDNIVIEVSDSGNTPGSSKSCNKKIKMVIYHFNYFLCK
ncbi:hypothetical protein POM88_054794 [Heracleum sosnowskyi]|uniref:Uncharacterized protein n=1 Tax=Heracleum sosnowskyi TaxID=360622 RepID=A0AAD8GM32_9APIA|nr:hypothetical protein POM88_054794 [Heracleum sosnowskyi]